MNIVVAGGTGLVGREILSFLAERPEVRVTALVRRAPQDLPIAKNIEYRISNFQFRQ